MNSNILSPSTNAWRNQGPTQQSAETYRRVQNAINSKDHTTLVAAVQAAGLVDTLSGEGPFMVFAPTNEAFAALRASVLLAAVTLSSMSTGAGAPWYMALFGRDTLLTAWESLPTGPRRRNRRPGYFRSWSTI